VDCLAVLQHSAGKPPWDVTGPSGHIGKAPCEEFLESGPVKEYVGFPTPLGGKFGIGSGPAWRPPAAPRNFLTGHPLTAPPTPSPSYC